MQFYGYVSGSLECELCFQYVLLIDHIMCLLTFMSSLNIDQYIDQ